MLLTESNHSIWNLVLLCHYRSEQDEMQQKTFAKNAELVFNSEYYFICQDRLTTFKPLPMKIHLQNSLTMSFEKPT